MRYVLSKEGRRALRTLTTRPILYAFDFDGTLAGISSDRGSVKLSRSMHEWLSKLAKKVPCAIVSGRSLSDLMPRMNGAVPYLIGNHGVESPLTPPAALSVAESVCQAWMKRVNTDFARPLKIADVEVENKRYTLTFHYRGAEKPARVRKELVLLLNRLTPAPRLIFGKASVNVLPPGKDGKGPAGLALMHHLQQTGLFFIGDDETDEDVFELSEGLAMGVRVGRYAKSRAQYYLNDQGELEEVIRFLVHRIDRTSESIDANNRDTRDRKREAHGL
ncbi:MAG: trehalose-phosphatase [Nitrospirae bacterium]|nr:trehalose-phosphatase [Nitrospirota bacterium]